MAFCRFCQFGFCPRNNPRMRLLVDYAKHIPLTIENGIGDYLQA